MLKKDNLNFFIFISIGLHALLLILISNFSQTFISPESSVIEIKIEKYVENTELSKSKEILKPEKNNLIKQNFNKKKESNTLKNDNSITMIGINYKDKKKNALNFLELYGNPFNKIYIDKQGTLSINFGAYGVPETFLINSEKKVLRKYIGPLNEKDIYEIKKIITYKLIKK